MGEIVSFASNGGTADGYLAKPASGTGKGVVVIQEWWGLNGNIKGIADRSAAEGFTALAPDLYHGKVVAEPDEAGKMLMALNIPQAGKDMDGAVAYLKGLTGGPVGTVGFCMGGALALFAACSNGKDVGACVGLYAGHPAVQFDWDNLSAPLLGIWADHDDFVYPNVPGWQAELEKRNKTFEFHSYPGTAHPFFKEEGESYNAEAAADAWQRTLAHFRANL